MTAALAPATALLGLALSLGTGGPAAPTKPEPPPAPALTSAARAHHAGLTSYQRDTTAAVTAAAQAASRVGAKAGAGILGAGRTGGTRGTGGPTGAGGVLTGLGMSCGGRSWPTAVKARITGLFGVSQIGGYRAGGGDHAAGLALDVMVGGNKARGDRVTRWSQSNAQALNIKYVIWYQRIWFPGKGMNQWRGMDDRGGATANHLDHVHLSFNPGKGKCG